MKVGNGPEAFQVYCRGAASATAPQSIVAPFPVNGPTANPAMRLTESRICIGFYVVMGFFQSLHAFVEWLWYRIESIKGCS